MLAKPEGERSRSERFKVYGYNKFGWRWVSDLPV